MPLPVISLNLGSVYWEKKEAEIMLNNDDGKETIKILFDTDIGSDIDDAFALAYLLANPRCDLLGITTVSGEAIERARLASMLCVAAGKTIPIFPGADVPLLIQQQQPLAQQKTALANWPHQEDFPRGEAVEFMRSVIRKNPGEVILLAVGPMTNIALLFSMDPEIAQLLRGLVLSCGRFSDAVTGIDDIDWNSLLDPHACSIVYKQSIRLHRSIGIDVSMRFMMNKSDATLRFNSRQLRPVMDMAQTWFLDNDRIYFFDPVAAVTVFKKDICSFQSGEVKVLLDPPNRMGRTIWQPNISNIHEVATGINPDFFFETYLSVFN
jgi:purine nucleosidase